MSDILDSLEDYDDEEETLEEFDDYDDESDEDEAISGEIVEFDEDFDLENYEMNERQAREHTEAIKSAATATFILIAQAHKHKAWAALGYSTWGEYVREEFDMTVARAYQLIDLNKAVEMIESVVPEGTKIKLTEAQARDIKRELPRITEELREETREMTPEEAAARTEEFIAEQRAELQEQKKADDAATKKKQQELDDAEDEGYRAGLEAAADSMLEADNVGGMTDVADDGFMDVEVDGDGQDIGPQDSMHIYNFFSMLSSVTSLPEPEEFINVIPNGRAEEVTNQLNEATAWLNRFHTLWELRDGE